MESTTQESIRERIKRLRRRLVITQKVLAIGSTVPLQTIKDIERGHTSVPRAKTIRALAIALNVSPSYLRNGYESLDNE